MTSSSLAMVALESSKEVLMTTTFFGRPQVLHALRGMRVIGLLDGSDPATPKTLVAEDENNKKIRTPNMDYVNLYSKFCSTRLGQMHS
jgi:hypothetical protein